MCVIFGNKLIRVRYRYDDNNSVDNKMLELSSCPYFNVPRGDGTLR